MVVDVCTLLPASGLSWSVPEAFWRIRFRLVGGRPYYPLAPIIYTAVRAPPPNRPIFPPPPSSQGVRRCKVDAREGHQGDLDEDRRAVLASVLASRLASLLGAAPVVHEVCPVRAVLRNPVGARLGYRIDDAVVTADGQRRSRDRWCAVDGRRHLVHGGPQSTDLPSDGAGRQSPRSAASVLDETSASRVPWRSTSGSP